MNAVVACTLVQWLQVYNVRAVQLVASLLGISDTRTYERRTLTLCTPCGAILRTVSITPTTEVVEICLDGEQFFLDGAFTAPLESASQLWNYVPSGGHLTVIQSKFEGVVAIRFDNPSFDANSVSWHPDGIKFAGGFGDNNPYLGHDFGFTQVHCDL